MHVVTYIGKGGYWEGKADGRSGWFPRLAIKELGDEEFDYSTITRETKPKTRIPLATSEVTLQSSSADPPDLPTGEIVEPLTSTPVHNISSTVPNTHDKVIRLVELNFFKTSAKS